MHHHKTGRGNKVMLYGMNTNTTIRQEDIKVMSYGGNIFTIIRQENIKVFLFLSYGGACIPTI
jgi:hypothetical protein